MKKPRKTHTSYLRELRDVTGMSQARFATRLGVTTGSIENYEMGRAKLPTSLAMRIGALVGALPESMQAGRILLGYDGKPFSERTYQKWMGIRYTDSEAHFLIGAAKSRLNTLLMAALGPTLRNTPHLFREVLIDFNQFIQSRSERLQLMSVIEIMGRGNFPPEHAETTVGDLRKRFGSAPSWKANDDKAWNNSLKASTTTTSFNLFVPFMTFEATNGKSSFVNMDEVIRESCEVKIESKSFSVIVDHRRPIYLRTSADAKTPPSISVRPLARPTGPETAAEFPKTAPLPSASPKRGNEKTKSVSPPGVPSRKR